MGQEQASMMVAFIDHSGLPPDLAAALSLLHASARTLTAARHVTNSGNFVLILIDRLLSSRILA
jgi:hypothetical protein